MNSPSSHAAVSTGLNEPSPTLRDLAVMDMSEALREYELWVTMGIQDLKRHYRRSTLGPLWLTLSLAILVVALGSLYGELMNRDYQRYIPHLALGFITWQFIQGIITDGCNIFIKNRNWLTNVRTPIMVFVFRMVWEHLIMMGHHMLVYIGVAVTFAIYAGLPGLLVIPGLILLILNAVWVVMLFGTLCTRFRDIPQLVQSLMRIAFFLTPIIWMPEQLGTRAHLAFFNPFTYFVELIRAPLLGEVPSIYTWMLALGVTVLGWSIAWLVFVRFRGRVTYWL